MGKWFLMGGGDVGRGHTIYETKIFDETIVKMTGKQHPYFLFVGLASQFSDSYYDTMKKIYQHLGCECAYLKKKNILYNPDLVKEKFAFADIIYFCGGDTIKLIANLEQFGVVPLLKGASIRGAVIAGMSAGAIMICQDGYSDALKLRGETEKYQFINGFSLLPLSVCPHYTSTGERGFSLKQELYNTTKKVLTLEDGTGFFVQDNQCEVVTTIPGRKAFLCFYEDGEYYEKELDAKTFPIAELI